MFQASEISNIDKKNKLDEECAKVHNKVLDGETGKELDSLISNSAISDDMTRSEIIEYCTY